MKKVFLKILLALIALSGCKNASVENGEECSIKLSGVEFTKSLNNTKSSAKIDGDKLILGSDAKRDNFNDPL